MVIYDSSCITRFYADKESVMVSCRMEACPQNKPGHFGF